MDNTARNNEAELDALRAINAPLLDGLLGELHHLRTENAYLKHTLAQLKHRLYGRSSEKVDPSQLEMALQIDAAAAAAAECSVTVPPGLNEAPDAEVVAPAPKKRRPNHHGRVPLPAHLERVRTEIHPEDLTCPCCSGELRRLGEETSEELGLRPAQFYVRQTVRVKYACPRCQDQIVRPELPEKLFERGLAGADVVAHVLVSKYGDHLPLHRQEMICRRQGVSLDKATMCDWVDRSADLLRPVVAALRRAVLAGPVAHADETPILYLISGERGSFRGWLWVYANLQGEVFYDFSRTRSRQWPDAVLAEYRGYLVVDGYTGYDAVLARDGVVYVACWAHARRKFRDALKTDPQPAAVILKAIGEMYKVEQQAREEGLEAEAVLALRQSRTAPLLEDLEAYLRALLPSVLPKSPLGKAVQYTLARWPALKVFAGDGRVPIDNNSAERAMRKVALGRNNWLFAGNETGGERAAVIYSLIETCGRLGINPHDYLTDVLQRVGSHPQSRVAELTPLGWLAAKATAAAPSNDQA
jgi:transposase